MTTSQTNQSPPMKRISPRLRAWAYDMAGALLMSDLDTMSFDEFEDAKERKEAIRLIAKRLLEKGRL